MREERIEVVVGEDGSMTAKTEGLKGETCLEELQTLMEAIAEVNGHEQTHEAFEQPPAARIRAADRLKGGRR